VLPGEVGEVISQGDNVMKGYWKLPEMTAETLRGGYLHTGDLATVDEEGYIYLTGRKKDIIVSGGHSVYPTEIEEVIYRHPSIAEAAVIGVPDKELGEAIKAIVVLKTGKRATAEEIIDFCRQNLTDYAVPKSVDFVPGLPRNPAGKILRRVLKEEHST
jgi:long-chain acyl-CoA synthetase